MSKKQWIITILKRLPKFNKALEWSPDVSYFSMPSHREKSSVLVSAKKVKQLS